MLPAVGWARAAPAAPDLDRPSMSGFGVDGFRLMQQVGWTLNAPDPHAKTSTRKAAGLVLPG